MAQGELKAVHSQLAEQKQQMAQQRSDNIMQMAAMQRQHLLHEVSIH
jgi:hypothetical protein